MDGAFVRADWSENERGAAIVFAFTFLGARQTPLTPSAFVETAAIAWDALLLGIATSRRASSSPWLRQGAAPVTPLLG